jgi:hypothetical protein
MTTDLKETVIHNRGTLGKNCAWAFFVLPSNWKKVATFFQFNENWPGGPLKFLDRYLGKVILNDALADRKMAFLCGPRQCGKTTLARHCLQNPGNEFNWDVQAFRKAWIKDPASAVESRSPGPILLDEIHKDRTWKSRLKGLWDEHGQETPIIVTGSARLDLFRRGGDSMLGRYIPYRVHPFSIGETIAPPSADLFLERDPQKTFSWEEYLQLGGFPEPLLGGSEAKTRRWSRLRTERLLREDVRDLRAIQSIRQLQLLTDLLPERVGSLLSLNSLRETLQVAHGTVKAWMESLEALYYCFLIRPYSKKLSRSLTAEPKLYLFDFSPIPQGGARVENAVALHLLKACHYWTDVGEGTFDLSFVRNKEKREVDFLIVRDSKPWMLVECKSNRTDVCSHLEKFSAELGTHLNFQLVTKPGVYKRFPSKKIAVISAEDFLGKLV